MHARSSPSQIYREYQDVPLTPTELSSVLTLLNLLHDNAALPDPFYVPDEDNALRSTGHCFFNDAPWLLHRIRRDGIYFTHARISAEAAAKWRIPSLSKVVKEHIDRSFLEACEASVQAAASARLTRTLQSRALAEGIHSVMCYCNANPLSLLDGDAVYKALSVFRVKVQPISFPFHPLPPLKMRFRGREVGSGYWRLGRRPSGKC